MRVKSAIIEKMPRSGRMRYAGIMLLAVILLALLVGSALLDRITFRQMDWEFWRGSVQAPTIIIYIILVSPIINGYWNRAINTLFPLIKDSKLKEKLITDLTKNDRWRESGTALASIGTIVVISHTWDGWPDGWFEWYRLVTQFTMIGLLGWLVYTGLRGVRNLTRLTRSIQYLDIFNLELLSPVAKWSLGVSLAFIGGITISLIFVPYDSLLNAISISVYGILIVTTILIFFSSMLSTHNAILRVKQRELNAAQEKLTIAFRKMRGSSSLGAEETDETVFSEVTAWGTYEANVRSIHDWPYTASILRQLLASLISPAIVYFIKVIFGVQFS